jgi:hypothetical protein
VSTEALVIPSIHAGGEKQGGPSLARLLPASVVAFIWPRMTALWGKATVTRAASVAVLNTLCAFVWIYLIFLAGAIWMYPVPRHGTPLSPFDAASYRQAATLLHARWSDQFHYIGMIDRIAFVVSVVFAVLVAYAVPFFMLLPFAARPGNNRACMRHVLRIILQGSGLVHWWGAAFFGVLTVCAAIRMPTIFEDYGKAITPLLFTFAGVTVWHMGVLIYAARREYRTSADMPKEHDPWCDVCGYILTGIEPTGRCPECGKPIQESLGELIRPPTAWEQRPSILNLRVIARQLGALVRHPRRLFYSMPTLSGQAAAQRWLSYSLALIFVAAIPIVPAIYLALDADWNFAMVPSTLAMCLVWTGFALMMVGIETGGIATFSRLRGHPGGGVYLAAAAKVTSYTAILMIPWVILGGAQLVAYTYFSTVHDVFRIHNVSYRWQQIILGGSLAISHIGGLLWYELTVYRGIRGIQYASK